MEKSAKQYIIGFLPGALITPENVDMLLEGWNRYFHQVGIFEAKEQRQELRAILRVRAQAGSISVVAPDIRQ
jgi:hypothetical protein